MTMKRKHIIRIAIIATMLGACTTPEEYDFSNKGGSTTFGDAVQLDDNGRNSEKTITFSENSGTSEFKVESVTAQTSEITIPAYVIYKGRRYTVTTLANRSFRDCNASTVTLPETITAIGDNTFSGESLTTINLKAVTPPQLGSRVLTDAGNAVVLVPQAVLTQYKSTTGWSNIAHRLSYIGDISWLNKPATNANGQSVSYMTDNGSDGTYKYTLDDNAMTASATLSTTNQEDYVVPAEVHLYFTVYTVTQLDDRAFNYASKMKTVTLPPTISQMGTRCFYGCSSLRQITLPEAVTKIPDECFSGCTELTTLTLPSELTSIGDNAFYSCRAIYKIELPATVTTIGNNAFRNCTGLESVICRAATPPSIGSQTFTFSNSQQCVIRVPAASVDAYKQAPNWRNLADRIVAI